jgi:two-component sensor histidine kinase
MLPDSFGIHSFIHLKPVVQRIPVIILTGVSDTNVALEAIKEGAQDYLVKGELTEGLLAKAIQYSTERKRTLEHLRVSDERFNTVVKATNDAIWDWDLVNGKLFIVGDTYKQLFGYDFVNAYPPDGLWESILHPKDKDRVLGKLSAIISEGAANINQILATSKLYLDVAIEENEPRLELLIKSRNNISMAIEEIRRLSKELITPGLNDLGLIQSIKELIRNIQVTGKMKIRLSTSGLDENALQPEQKINVYRIIQEQLNNIMKHAEASSVAIELNKYREQIRLLVEDDGRGFDPRLRRNGVGISNIMSRAELYNGRVEIDSSPGKGCRLEVILNSKA